MCGHTHTNWRRRDDSSLSAREALNSEFTSRELRGFCPFARARYERAALALNLHLVTQSGWGRDGGGGRLSYKHTCGLAHGATATGFHETVLVRVGAGRESFAVASLRVGGGGFRRRMCPVNWPSHTL